VHVCPVGGLELSVAGDHRRLLALSAASESARDDGEQRGDEEEGTHRVATSQRE
jgi:hypothetical protein